MKAHNGRVKASFVTFLAGASIILLGTGCFIVVTGTGPTENRVTYSGERGDTIHTTGPPIRFSHVYESTELAFEGEVRRVHAARFNTESGGLPDVKGPDPAQALRRMHVITEVDIEISNVLGRRPSAEPYEATTIRLRLTGGEIIKDMSDLSDSDRAAYRIEPLPETDKVPGEVRWLQSTNVSIRSGDKVIVLVGQQSFVNVDKLSADKRPVYESFPAPAMQAGIFRISGSSVEKPTNLADEVGGANDLRRVVEALSKESEPAKRQ
jgi:hypothetical protein